MIGLLWTLACIALSWWTGNAAYAFLGSGFALLFIWPVTNLKGGLPRRNKHD